MRLASVLTEFEHPHRIVDHQHRDEQMVVVVARHDIAWNLRVGQAPGDGCDEPYGIERRVDRQA